MAIEETTPPRVLTGEVLYRFFQRFVLYRGSVASLHIVSPWITNWKARDVTLQLVVETVQRRRIPTYVVTRPPELPHQWAAVEELARLPVVEVTFIPNLHAKYYVCESIPAGFGLIASANLTAGSAENWEIGVIFDGRGGLESTVNTLMDATHTLRSLSDAHVYSSSRNAR
jgi:hypothetical protein